MAERWRRAGVGVATALASLALLMAVAAVALSFDNAHRQAEVARREVFIDQSQTLARVNGALITALADAAVHQHDTAIQSVLARAGITASLRTARAAPSPGATIPGATTVPTTADHPAITAAAQAADGRQPNGRQP